MADDVVPDRLAEYCEHGRNIGWCDACKVRELRAEVERLRGALQALVDAVDDNEFAGFFTARAAAVALLAGPAGDEKP